MATTAFQGAPVHTVGEIPAVGAKAPDFVLTGSDLSDVKLSDYAGKRVVLNIFPSLDTSVCAMSVRTFNQRAASLDNTVVLCISADLPFAAGRFCVAEGINDVVPGSTFRSNFGELYGVRLVDGPLAGLMARTVIVVDTDGTVLYSRLNPEITEEVDFDAALASLK
ncbi:MAG: thiol peroxidase [Arcanobacterium sp.]|nr:thiol peroxidase [Arcanobacterium sp.]